MHVVFKLWFLEIDVPRAATVTYLLPAGSVPPVSFMVSWFLDRWGFARKWELHERQYSQ